MIRFSRTESVNSIYQAILGYNRLNCVSKCLVYVARNLLQDDNLPFTRVFSESLSFEMKKWIFWDSFLLCLIA